MTKLAYLGCAVLVVAGVSCKKLDPNYCPGANPNNNCLDIDASTDTRCTTSDECTPEVCDTTGGICVECTPSEPGACTASSPICGDDFSCRGCESHAECPSSNVCGPDGACIDAAQVAYVQGGATGSTCTKAAPCGTLRAALALNPPRAVVKFATGTVEDNQTSSIDGRAVTMLADPGAKLDRSNNGTILEIRNDGADVRIYDLEISGGTGSTFPAISILPGGTPKLLLSRGRIVDNQGLGISSGTGGSVTIVHSTLSGNAGGGIASTGGSLTVRQSTVSGNTGGGISSTAGSLTVQQSTISLNTAGGVAISGGQFDISNTFIVSNGGAGSLLGGVEISGINTATGQRFEFNTISANLGPATINTGINCGTITTPLTFSNNIVFNNIVSGGGKQVGGSANCLTTYSNVGPDGMSGTGNVNTAPLFISAGTGNFHLQATSPMRDVAEPAATLPVDFDDQPRPQGAGRDIGADEIP